MAYDVARQEPRQKYYIPKEYFDRGWNHNDSELGWTLETPVGVAIVKLTRGYPRSRNFRVIVNGKDIDRFVKSPVEAMDIAEAALKEIMQKKTGL